MTDTRISMIIESETDKFLKDYILQKLNTCRYCPACESSSINALYRPLDRDQLCCSDIFTYDPDNITGYFVVYCEDCGRKLEKILPARNGYEIHESISCIFNAWNNLPPE